MRQGHATADQVERMIHLHLLNPTGFCVTPEDDWPPATPVADPDLVMLQSWHPTAHGQDIVLCRDGADHPMSDGSTAPGGCATLKATGGSFVRNESLAWSPHSPATGRIPLFLFRLTASNQTIIGSTSSFPAADKVSDMPVCYVAETPPQPGAWPLQLWSSDRAHVSSHSTSHGTTLSSSDLRYRISVRP